MSAKLCSVALGTIGSVVLTATVVALGLIKVPDYSVRTVALLGITLVASNTLVEMFFIKKVFWFWQPYDGVPDAATTGLPLGKSHQFGCLGLLMISTAALTYAFANPPTGNPYVPLVLGIQFAAGAVMTGRAFLIKEVVYTPGLDAELASYLTFDLMMCIWALAVSGLQVSWWHISILLQMFWIVVGYTHHLEPLREYIKLRSAAQPTR